MTAEIDLKNWIYNYWTWFESQYIDEDTLPSGMYRAPDGDVANAEQIKESFKNDVIEKLNEVLDFN